jgi:hypothetical protein
MVQTRRQEQARRQEVEEQRRQEEQQERERKCASMEAMEARLSDALQHDDSAAVEALLANHELAVEHLFPSLPGPVKSTTTRLFPNKWRPLHAAACRGAAGCIRALLAANAAVDSEIDYFANAHGFTPLMAAAVFLQPKAVRLLLESGANLWLSLSGSANVHGDQTLTLCMKVMSLNSC